jgi:hypothetical protein
MQLSLIPDLVSEQPQQKKQASSRQLSLNILGSVADTRPKQVLSTSEAWYKGKLCTVLRRSREDFDGVIIKICTIKTQCGEVLDVPENHVTIL